MQHPVYKFYPGQEVFVEPDRSKSTVVAVVDDKYDDYTLRLVVTKQWIAHKQYYAYHIYREFEASTMMYMMGRELWSEKKSVRPILKKWEVDRVYNYGPKGELVEVPREEWDIKEFK